MKPKIERCEKCGKVKRLTWPSMPDFETFKKFHQRKYAAKCDCETREKAANNKIEG